jgi:hypothetical protein
MDARADSGNRFDHHVFFARRASSSAAIARSYSRTKRLAMPAPPEVHGELVETLDPIGKWGKT